MNVGIVQNTYSGITNGKGALQSARLSSDTEKFNDLIGRMQAQNEGRGTLSSNQIAEAGRLNGEYTTGYKGAFSLEADKEALPTGAAVNQANPNVKPSKIDKTSKLYESALELEGYFVKQMLSAMRKTVAKAYDADFATQTYEDMLYDEYATALTKNAGFGLADQIYLSLV
ncbi:MAG: rod-binding protein [Treponema sp.]|nr:rod-binding protein [Treponema sp.]